MRTRLLAVMATGFLAVPLASTAALASPASPQHKCDATTTGAEEKCEKDHKCPESTPDHKCEE